MFFRNPTSPSCSTAVATVFVLLLTFAWNLHLVAAQTGVEDGGLPADEGVTDGAAVGIFDHTLHVVILEPSMVLDQGSGSAPVKLDGSPSHTHEPGGSLTGYSWTINGEEIGTDVSVEFELEGPSQEVCLQIIDNSGETLDDCVTIVLQDPTDLQGTELSYFSGNASFADAEGQPDQTEFREEYGIEGLPAVRPPFVVKFLG